MRLHGREANLGEYRLPLKDIAMSAPGLASLPETYPSFFTTFDALFEAVRRGRNDAMHAGSYARHVTNAAVDLCIGLEEAVMSGRDIPTKVKDYMVRAPIQTDRLHPVAHARQLVLKYSFSFLPLFCEQRWWLLSEMALVTYLRPKTNSERRRCLALSLEAARADGLALLETVCIHPDDEVALIVEQHTASPNPTLWLVVDTSGALVGVLSPFELM